MAAKTAWPTNTELTAYLPTIGVTATIPTATQDDSIAEALNVAARELGFWPYLAEDTAQDYLLDPPRRSWLDLRANFFSIVSVELDGTALTINEDFWPTPADGPYTGLELATPWCGDPQTITVNGKRGVSDVIPDDLYRAVLRYAAGAIYEEQMMAGTVALGPVVEVEQRDMRKKFAGGSAAQGQDTASKLKNGAISVFRSYRKPGIGGI
jgi:hypothetical protein